MKQLIKLMCICLALLLQWGCTKENKQYVTKNETVSGYVIDAETGDTVPGIKLRLRADGGWSQPA
ncbi:MAG: hypothetical protein U5L96_05125 [Owenweeksia sp.]|nr:hypothetical protein [Owenweeksia sp.]